MVDLNTVLESIKLRLEQITGKSFRSVQSEMTPPPLLRSEQKKERDKQIWNFARYFSTTSSREGYDKMRKEYTVSQNMKKEEFPSYYKIRKVDRPDIIPIDLEKENDATNEINFQEAGLDVNLNSTDYIIDQPESKLTVKSFIGKKDVKMSDALDDIRKSKDSAAILNVLTTRVKESFSTYIEYMEDMFKKSMGK